MSATDSALVQNARPLAAILANPRAGRFSSRHLLDELAGSLAGFGIEPFICREREELDRVVAERNRQLHCVVAVGGDGTINELLNRAPGIPLAVLPVGNENLVARHFGFVRDVHQLASLVANGHEKHFDLGRANRRMFAIMASAGFDAEVVHRVHRKRRGHVNKLSYGWQIARAANEYAFPPIDVEIVDTGERLRGSLVLVFNLPRYGLGLPIAAGADPGDGWLDLCVFERPGVVYAVRYLAAVLSRRHERMPDVRHRRVRRVRMWSAKVVPLQADGDPAGFLPATVEVAAGAWRLLVAKADTHSATMRERLDYP